jgi:hypothetical protein
MRARARRNERGPAGLRAVDSARDPRHARKPASIRKGLCLEALSGRPVTVSHGTRHADDRIKVAYVSSDFREHSVSYLLAGLIERHDRPKFAPIAVSPSGARATWRRRRSWRGCRRASARRPHYSPPAISAINAPIQIPRRSDGPHFNPACGMSDRYSRSRTAYTSDAATTMPGATSGTTRHIFIWNLFY